MSPPPTRFFTAEELAERRERGVPDSVRCEMCADHGIMAVGPGEVFDCLCLDASLVEVDPKEICEECHGSGTYLDIGYDWSVWRKCYCGAGADVSSG